MTGVQNSAYSTVMCKFGSYVNVKSILTVFALEDSSCENELIINVYSYTL